MGTQQVNGVRTFTWKEVTESVPKKSNAHAIASHALLHPDSPAPPVYTVISDKVYDLSGDFFSWHPGGGVAFSQLGKDSTDAFDVFHPVETREMLASFYVGDLAADQIRKDPTGVNGGFAEDVARLRAEIESKGWYASSKVWYARCIAQTLAICATAVFILARFPDSMVGVLASAFLVALFWQQCGWLAHDFAHHQVFQNRYWNNFVGYFLGNVCQGFSVAWWKHKHCTHHSVPNVHSGDPDINTMPFLAWSEHALEGFADLDNGALAKFFVTYQPLFYFPLLCVARANWALSSILWNVKDVSVHGFVFPTNSLVELSTLAAHWAAYIGSAFYFLTPGYALVWLLCSQAFCGVLLAAVFSVNHNGMPVYTSAEAADINFYHLAIATGRDVHTSTFNDWFTGGLNMQIEHHMFPVVPRHNLPKIQSRVKALCAKHEIPYHETTLANGLYEVVARLATVSKAARKGNKAQ